MIDLRNRLIPFLAGLPRILRFIPTLVCAIAVASLALVPIPALAQRQMEALGRGMIVVRSTSTQAYIGWRLLGDDPAGIAFNLYRSANGGAAVKLNASPLTASTNFTDTTASFTVGNAYFVRPVLDGAEQAAGATFTLPANTAVQQYLTVPLQIPPGGTNVDGSYTYTANDCSVGDLDGDGEYEIIVKWDPTNSKDNSQSGHTGDTYLDAYKPDGTRLWRIDLGVNIRSGAHYMDFMVYDFDGDGRAELMCRTAPGSLDATGAYVGGAAKWQGGARPAFNDTDDYRNSGGYILTGPEFLSVFDGATGAELATVRFVPQRDPDNLIDNPSASRLNTLWGDSYGNRIDRFLAAVAYVDGQRPTGIFARGYYTRTFLTAWDWRDGQLTRRWTFDSGTGPTSNRAYAGQGAHSISVGDLDGDGKDEIAYGACAINDDGTGLWTTGLGHGDATHLSEMDPDKPGLKFFMPHESPSSYGIHGTSLTEQRDGDVLWGTPAGGDVGRGAAFDIDPRYPGYEAWATNSSSVYTIKGVPIATSTRPSVNFGVWWDADPLRELLDSNRIDKWVPASANVTRLLTMSGVSSNNSTKATPNLSGDILGDWREEIVMRTSDNTALRIYTTVVPATTRLYTLMHDPQYREAIAWQNTGYNQPPHPGFFLGHDMAAPPRAPIWHGDLVWKGAAGANTWDADASARWLRAGAASTFTGTDSVLLDHSGDTSSVLTLSGTLTPGEVVVHNARNKDYTFAGTGTLSGPMTLTKAGIGALTLQSAHAYTGATLVQQGDFNVNGSLAASPATVEGLGRVAGVGTLGAGLVVKARGRVAPGAPASTAGTLSVGGRLELNSAVLELDLGATPAEARDQIAVTGDLVLTGVTRLEFRLSGGAPGPGSYPLMAYTGTLTGSLANFSVTGLAGAPGTLAFSGGALVLNVAATRAPGALVWRGSGSAWDLATSQNWLLSGAPDVFVTGDAVRFDATGAAAATVSLATEMFPASVTVDATTSYTVTGAGAFGGAGGLTKAGTGTLTVQTANTYTGPTTLNGGVLSVASVTAAGVPGPLGAASATPANLVFNGGTLRYTGSLSFSTDHGATLAAGGGTVEISTGSASLVWAGGLTGSGVLTKTGPGTLNIAGVNTYAGGTVIKAGTILLGSFDANEDGVGTGLVTLDGGTLSMTDLQSNNSCSWSLFVPADSTGRLNADGRCTLTGALTGAGTFTFFTPFSRTALSGNWSNFTGQINVVADGDGGDFRINNSAGYAKATLNFADQVYAYSLTGSTSLGALSGSTGAVLSGTAWTIGAKNIDSTFAGVITGNSLTKVGTGALTLAPSATTSLATTTVSGSATVTLASTAGLVAQMPVSGTGIPAGTRIGGVTSATTLTLTKAATASGNPTLAYADINTYTGATTVSAGALVVNGVLGSSAVTVAPGAALGGTGVFGGPVTFQSGSLLRVGPAGGPVFAGAPAFSGTVGVVPAGTLPAGTYPIFTYEGSLTGTPAFAWSGPGYTATFNTATPGVVSMTLTADGARPPADLVWTGAAGRIWDTTVVNWEFAAGGAAGFLSGDRVRFDDTLVANPAVAPIGAMSPASVTVDNNTAAYTLVSTDGSLTGPGTLLKTGPGTLGISGANTFTGGVTLQAGTLTLTNEAANLSGLGTGPLTLEGGTLQQLDNTSSYSATTYDLRVPAGASPTLRVDSRMDLSGPLTGAGTLGLHVPWVRFKVLGDWSLFTGRINVTSDADGGLFRLANTAALPFARVDLGSKVTLLSFLNQNQTLALGALSGTAGDATLSGIVPDNNTPGANTVTWQVGGLGTDTTFAGAITNGTSPSRTALTKVGAGTLTLTGAGTYTGPTIVSAGTLAWGGTLGNSSTVEVLAGATLRLTGTLTVSSVTIRAGGTLTGGGTINGTLVNEGSFLADGPAAWTVNGSVTNSGTIRFTRGAALAVSGALANSGTLDLITAGSAPPGGLGGSGTVLTAASVATPVITSGLGGDIQISITTHVGHLYQLQRRTDLAGGAWADVGAAQSGTGGSLVFTDPLVASDPKVFYRVVVAP